MAFSLAIVEYRSLLMFLPQGDPAPCAGNTWKGGEEGGGRGEEGGGRGEEGGGRGERGGGRGGREGRKLS